MFQVTNLNLKNIPQFKETLIILRIFWKKTNLTVSGQLEARVRSLSLGQVYTFGQPLELKIQILLVTYQSFG